MKVLGIVPARMGSKRVVGKNMRTLGGKPLTQWVIEAALGASRIDRVVVSSDDEKVLELARSLGEHLPLPRPPELAADTSPAVDYVLHALGALEARGEGPFDAVCIAQPSSPFTTSADIDATIGLLVETKADTAVSVMELDHAIHPVKLKVMDGDRLLPFLEDERGRMAAHELPKIFVRNCSVYVSKRSVFVEHKTVIGPDMRGYVMPRERSLDINTEQDMLLAELMMSRVVPR